MAGTKACLDSLPLELKVHILKTLSTVPSLSILVHSSPNYHAVYVTDREAILTAVTLRELNSKSIDVLESFPIVEVRLKDKELIQVLKSAVLAARQQHDEGKAIKLEIHQSIALRSILNWFGFDVEEGPSGDHTARWYGWETRDALAANQDVVAHCTLSFGPYSDDKAQKMVENTYFGPSIAWRGG